MFIKEVNFLKIDEYDGKKVIPVFMQYGNKYYEIAYDKKYADDAWRIFQKIFYYNFYNENKKYLDSLFEKKLFLPECLMDKILFSKSDKTFGNHKTLGKDTAIKFGANEYTLVLSNNYENLVVLKKIVKESNLKNFKIFITTEEEIKQPKFKKYFTDLKNKLCQKTSNRYQTKKGNLVVGHINGLILSNQEKLIKYVRNEFNKKTLLGDIILNEEQENTLNLYMKDQLERFDRNPAGFKPHYCRVFALGLVRYSMKNYNTKGKADFWPYFKEEYNISITANNQKYINLIFEDIMKKTKNIYSEDTSKKIDNITMHAFVANNSADQLFDYLFDFWRLDLVRNVSNLNASEKGVSDFEILIKAMQKGVQDVMSHTSLLLNSDKTKRAFKNRIKRIIRLMNNAFWENTGVHETGNRINHLLNCWMKKPRGAFQKEKENLSKFNSKGKFVKKSHSPCLKVDYKDEILNIILPHTRLFECTKEDKLRWIIKCSSTDYVMQDIPVNEHYKLDKISFYVEEIFIKVPLHFMLCEFEFLLMSEDKVLKKHKINSSKIRFFDEKGEYVDYKNSIIPAGQIVSYSDNKNYPELLGEVNNHEISDGLIIKYFNLAKGQVVTLDDNTGIQVGQKLTEGLSEAYHIKGVKIIHEGNTYNVYNKLPKLLFKANEEELKGISLVINDKQNMIYENNIYEFKIAEEVKTAWYLIDIKDYIGSEGLYRIVLNYPKTHKRIEIGYFAFIKDFEYNFIGAPYIFKDEAKIEIFGNIKITEKEIEKHGIWTKNYLSQTFEFNFVEKDEYKDNFCRLVDEKNLVMKCIVGAKESLVSFDIPALYWKFSTDGEWNTKKPVDVALKELKKSKKRLYVAGPFNFTEITTTDDIDIADEENKIRFNEKNKCFEISNIYNWFNNNRSEVYRSLYLTFDGEKVPIFNVICKSKLNDVNIVGDFDNNLLIGSLDIEGDENYTISIYHDRNVICEDEPIVNKQFSIKTELRTGKYKIYVYELIEEDEDGFDVASETFILNKNPIEKRIVNFNDLEGKRIRVCGYQDIDKKFKVHNFDAKYIISDLEKTCYNDFFRGKDAEIYGIWRKNINRDDPEEMNKYIMYKGKLGFYYSYSDEFRYMMDVIIFYTDKSNAESILILTTDPDGPDYAGLYINIDQEQIITGEDYFKKLKPARRRCRLFYDDEYYYITKVEE